LQAMIKAFRPAWAALGLLCFTNEAGATSLRRDVKAGSLCEFAEKEPLLSCKKVAAGGSSWNANLHEAWHQLCQDSQTSPYMEVFQDKRFKENYHHVYKSDGWADSAWVNYVAVKKSGGVFGKLTERLVESIHRFSQHPIIVVNFGQEAPEELSPRRFPRLVLLHARGFDPALRLSFNFNKLRAILLAQAKVGASLDSDMLLVGPQADQLLNRTAEEITEKYRFPMMPTHFLDRDLRDKNSGKGNFLPYSCKNCPEPTMRWGQAQPTWTHWSFPFVSRWLTAKMKGRSQNGVPTDDIAEDEDLLNVALWSEGATKSWCAFQTGGINFLWENLYPQHPPGPYPYYEDPRYFPAGIPVAFWFGHAEKDPAHIDNALTFLSDSSRINTQPPKPFYHNMTFFASFKELKQAYPDLKCTL